jgi:uncharacterized membrane protein
MTFIDKFHPLLVHFPIALVLAAAAAELVVIATPRKAKNDETERRRGTGHIVVASAWGARR